MFATGSGGTASGLSIANYLTGSKLKYVNINYFVNENQFRPQGTYRRHGKIRWAKHSRFSSLLQKFFREFLAIGK